MKATTLTIALPRWPRITPWVLLGAVAASFLAISLSGTANATLNGPSDIVCSEPLAGDVLGDSGPIKDDTATAAALQFARPTDKYPRRIYAHYFPANTVASGPLYEQRVRLSELRHDRPAYGPGAYIRNWDLVPPKTHLSLPDSLDLDVRRAIRGGIDGFAVEMDGSAYAKEVLDTLFRVVETKDYPFSVTISLSALPIDEDLGKSVVAARGLLDAHARSRKIARRDGKVLVFGCQAKSPTSRVLSIEEGWRMVTIAQRDLEKKVGQPLYCQFSMDGFFDQVDLAKLKGARPPREPGSWGVKAAGALSRVYPALGAGVDVNYLRELDSIAKAVKGNKSEWCQPLWFQQDDLTGPAHVGNGTDIFRDRWRRAGATRSLLMEMTTWNGYRDSSNLAPACNTRYSLLDLNAYFVQWWKTGKQPVTDHDRVYLIYRKYVSGSKTYPFKSERFVNGVLEVVTVLTRRATIRLPERDITYQAPPGLAVKQFPLIVGSVSAQVIRGDELVLTLESPEPITDKPYREDNGLLCYSTEDARHWNADFGNAPAFFCNENGDADGDGLPNWFEMYWFGRLGDLSTASVADPRADPDGDGATNLEEYLAQTDPTHGDLAPRDLGKATRLAFFSQPVDTPAGMGIAPAIKILIQDAQGNTVPTANDLITLSLGANPAGGALAGTTSVRAVNGEAVFEALRIEKAGRGYTLTASAADLKPATSQAFNVTAGPASTLAFQTQPAPTGAGSKMRPAVQVGVSDAFGNPAASDPREVRLAIQANPSGGALSGTATRTSVADGLASFDDLSIDKPGSGYTLVATAAGLAPAVSAPFDISRLAFLVQPVDTPAGAPVSPAVKVAVLDATGNPLPNAANEITLALGTNAASGELTGSLTARAVNGVATFSDLKIDKAGAGYTLVASESGLSQVTSTAFTVTPGIGVKLAFAAPIPGAVAGRPISPGVQVVVQDAAGNVVPGATDAITLAVGNNPVGGALSGTLTAKAIGGSVTFNDLSIDKAGADYTLTATAPGLAPATSPPFSVAAGAPVQIAFQPGPTDAPAGETLNPVRVVIQDAFGNTVSNALNEVNLTLASNPSGATMRGATTLKAVNGAATFTDLMINKAGDGYTLRATTTIGTRVTLTSAAFNVVPGTTAVLVFTKQPATTQAKKTLPPVIVTVQDGAGNVVTTSNALITLVIGTNYPQPDPAGGTLEGVTTVKAVNGIAVFSDLNIDVPAFGYRLRAKSPDMLDAVSNRFHVTVPPRK